MPLLQVFRAAFWMAFYNSPSPKRTVCWSTRKEIRLFWLGKLTKKVREELKKKHPGFRTTIKYIDSSGRKRYHGSKSLKSTGTFFWHWASSLSLLLFFACYMLLHIVHHISSIVCKSTWGFTQRSLPTVWPIFSRRRSPLTTLHLPPMLQPSWHRFGGRRTLVTNGQTLVCQILFDIWWGPVASKFHHNGSGSYQLNFEHAALIQNYQRVPAEDCCTLNRLLLALSQDHTNSLVIHSCKDSTCVVERSWKNLFSVATGMDCRGMDADEMCCAWFSHVHNDAWWLSVGTSWN